MTRRRGAPPWIGAKIGAMIGLAFGTVFATASIVNLAGNPASPRGDMFAWAAIGIVAGLVVGTGLGALAGTLQWVVMAATRKIPLPRVVRHVGSLVIALALCFVAMLALYNLVQGQPLTGWPLWVAVTALTTGTVVLGVHTRPRTASRPR